MRKTFSLFCLVAILAGACAAAGNDSERQVLARWVGRWTSSGHLLDTAYTHAGEASGKMTCAWSPRQLFVVCDQENLVAGRPDRAITVYGYAPGQQKYTFANIPADGSAPRTPALTVDGDTWTYSNSFTKDGKTTMFRTVNTWKGNDQVDFRGEYSIDDGATWTTMVSGSDHREK